MKLIGSQKIKQLYPDFRDVSASDWDFLSDKNLKSASKVELVYIPALNDIEITGDVLYTLKVSHSFWNYNRQKHLFDIDFLKKKGCKIIPDLFDTLFLFWESVHGKRTMPDFRKTYEEFFDDYIDHSVNHDDIHYAISETPMFTKILKGDGTVDICEEKFNALKYEDQLNVIREECMVLVFERYYVKGIFEKHWKTYYSEMLMKLLQNLSPLWMAVFISTNHRQLLTIKNLKNEWNRISGKINRIEPVGL